MALPVPVKAPTVWRACPPGIFKYPSPYPALVTNLYFLVAFPPSDKSSFPCLIPFFTSFFTALIIPDSETIYRLKLEKKK